MKQALISVSNKEGIKDFASSLIALGYRILSTGGSARLLKSEDIGVTAVEEITQMPEMLDGRVKTLHPAIHAAILAQRHKSEHQQQLQDSKICPIDIVAVNFYPFEEAMQRQASWQELIENIDIGGPSMVRSAAKNYQDVLVLVDPLDYIDIIERLRVKGHVELDFRKYLAVKALRYTAYYDALISNCLGSFLEEEGEFPDLISVPLRRFDLLRYGENPHQSAAVYQRPLARKNSLLSYEQLHGKDLSYNNLQDVEAAVNLIRTLEKPAVVAIKHANPCGVGEADNLLSAWDKAYASDPVSIFGGIIAVNGLLEKELAEKIAQIFVEVIIAQEFSPEALTVLQKKKNLRLLRLSNMAPRKNAEKLISIDGGLLWWKDKASAPAWDTVVEAHLTAVQKADLLLAWRVVAKVKSNAIVLVKDGATVGIGAGQMNRVGAAKIALEQAGSKAVGAVMASDAFFPFADTAELAAAAKIAAIVQPGGSLRDAETETVCEKHSIAMFYTKQREFVH